MVISTNLGYLGSWIGSHFQKEKKISSWPVYVLHKTGIQALLRRSRAETAKKCTKKYAAGAYYTYCFLERFGQLVELALYKLCYVMLC